MKQEILMTTEEYLNRIKQEELDKIFDDAINEAHQEELKRLKSIEYESYIQNLITKKADYESELFILEDLYDTYLISEEYDSVHLNKLKEEIKQMKVRLTKTDNELNIALQKEVCIC